MTNEIVEAIKGATLFVQPPALIHGINATYALVAVIAGWATHVNWPRIIAAGTWIANHGGIVGIARKLISGR